MPDLYSEVGNFAVIPHSFIEDERMGCWEISLYVCLIKHVNRNRKDGRVVFPSIKTLEKLMLCKKDRIQTSIKKLEDTGWLLVKREKGIVNEYFLYGKRVGDKNAYGRRFDSVVVGDENASNKNKEIRNKETEIVEDVFNYLKEKSGRKRLKLTKATANPIQARLDGGYSSSDLRHVIDVKCEEWKDDERFSQYLTTTTLFRVSNIDKYLAQEIKHGNGVRTQKCPSCGHSGGTIGIGKRRRCLKCNNHY